MLSRISRIRNFKLCSTSLGLRGTYRALPNQNTQRYYAQSWDGRQPNDKVDAHIKVQQLMDKIQSHPIVMEKLEKVSQIMVTKGLASDDSAKPLGPWQMIKILMDKDLKIAMSDFKQELEKSGIELGPNQLGPLMSVLGIEKK